MRVGVALIGLGGWGGSSSLPALEETENLELITWYDANPATVEEYRGRIVPQPAESYEEVLDNPQVDGVLLFVPNHLHRPLAVQAAEHGKHVWVEKPIANSVSEADEMIAACERMGVVLSIGHSLRRHPTVRLARKMIEEGKIGDLVMFDGHQSHRGGWSLTPDMWRWYADKCPGGPMNVLGIHQIDIMHYLVGPIAEAAGIMTKKYREYEAPEITAATLRFRNDLLGTVGCSYVSPQKTSANIYGTTGYIECRLDTNTITLYDIKAQPQTTTVNEHNLIAEEFGEFGQCILEGKRPETGGSEARAAVAVLEAIIESARTGRSVCVDPQERVSNGS